MSKYVKHADQYPNGLALPLRIQLPPFGSKSWGHFLSLGIPHPYRQRSQDPSGFSLLKGSSYTDLSSSFPAPSPMELASSALALSKISFGDLYSLLPLGKRISPATCSLALYQSTVGIWVSNKSVRSQPLSLVHNIDTDKSGGWLGHNQSFCTYFSSCLPASLHWCGLQLQLS